MIITFFTDGSSQISASMQNSTHNTYYQTIDLKQTSMHIQAQIEAFLPPSTKRILYNETGFQDKYKQNRFKIIQLIKQAVNKFCLVNQTNIPLIAMPLNKAILYTKSHIENNDEKSRYFYNQCLYHYDRYKCTVF